MSLIDKYRNYYLSSKFIFLIDLVLSVVSSYIVLLTLRLLVKNAVPIGTVGIYLLASFFATAAMMLLTSTAKIVIRHLTIRDLVPFGIASIGKAVAIGVVLLLTKGIGEWMITAIVVDTLLTFVFFLAVRIVMILVFDYSNNKMRDQAKHMRVLVYETSDKSVATIVRLQNSEHYKVEGFLHRSSKSDSKVLERLPIFNFDSREKLDKIFRARGVSAVLFARDIDAQKEESGLIADCHALGVKTLIVPSVDEFVEGKSLFRPREIKVEDLLGRDEIIISLDEIKANFEGKTVMVTGAAGSIGSELVRQLASFGVKKLVLFDNAETPMHNLRLELEDKFNGLDFVPIIGDVRQNQRLRFAFESHHPQVVFHAAAYKHVPLMEENPCEAVLVNVYGSRNVADMCLKYGVEKMVMISTDKAVNPTSVMGATKRVCEMIFQSRTDSKTNFCCTRFGNVLGSRGSVVPLFRRQIEAGGPVTITDKRITRYFMTIPEACQLVLQAGAMSRCGELYVLDMGQPVKILDLAEALIRLMGHEPYKDIDIVEIGLRPGEKLYEELHIQGEEFEKTENDLIFVERDKPKTRQEIAATLEMLHEASDQNDDAAAKHALEQAVPTFRGKEMTE